MFMFTLSGLSCLMKTDHNEIDYWNFVYKLQKRVAKKLIMGCYLFMFCTSLILISADA